VVLFSFSPCLLFGVFQLSAMSDSSIPLSGDPPVLELHPHVDVDVDVDLNNKEENDFYHLDLALQPPPKPLRIIMSKIKKDPLIPIGSTIHRQTYIHTY